MKANDNVRRERMKHGYKQSHVASYVGISQKLYSRTENSRRNLTLQEAGKLAKLYGQTPEYFYGIADAAPPHKSQNPDLVKLLLDILQKLPKGKVDAAQINSALLMLLIDLLSERK